MEVSDVFEYIYNKYGYERCTLIRQNKEAKISNVRNIAMYMVVKFCGYSYPQTGEVFHRHHTTVMNAYSKVLDLIADGKVDFDFNVPKRERPILPAVESKVFLDDILNVSIIRVKERIMKAYEKNPVSTLKGLLDLAERLENEH